MPKEMAWEWCTGNVRLHNSHFIVHMTSVTGGTWKRIKKTVTVDGIDTDIY